MLTCKGYNGYAVCNGPVFWGDSVKRGLGIPYLVVHTLLSGVTLPYVVVVSSGCIGVDLGLGVWSLLGAFRTGFRGGGS